MASAEEERTMEEELSYPILLADRIRKAAEEANSFKFELSEVSKQVETLSQKLRSVAKIAMSYSTTSSSSSTSVFYECPVRRILHGVVRITSATDFRKLITVLDSAVADMKWLLSVFDSCTSGGSGMGGGMGGLYNKLGREVGRLERL